MINMDDATVALVVILVGFLLIRKTKKAIHLVIVIAALAALVVYWIPTHIL